MSSDFIRRKFGVHFTANQTVVDASVWPPTSNSQQSNSQQATVVKATTHEPVEVVPAAPPIKSSLTFGDLLSQEETVIRPKKVQKLNDADDLWDVDTSAILSASTPTKKVPKSNSLSPSTLSPRLVNPPQEAVDIAHEYDDIKPSFEVSRIKQPMQPLDLGNGKILNKYFYQYLFDHQVDGITWLWSKFSQGIGCILGDDMGMGIESTDRLTLAQRSRDPDSCERPALIIVPASLIDNWFIELKAWGYFNFRTLKKKKEREEVLKALKQGRIEGVVISYQSMKARIKELRQIDFSVIIFDEAHLMKSLATQMYQTALKLKRSQCNILLSGTIMQNHVGELWSLCNICKKGKDWCDFNEFQAYYTNPITISMNSKATREEIELGDERKDELYRFLSGFHIRRDKSELPESVQMKGKDDIIVMCELSPVQKALMAECLAFPDVQVMTEKADPETVFLNEEEDEDSINPLAVIWRLNHPNNKRCKMCSGGNTCKCIFYPTLSKLLKIVSHPASLQVDRSMLDKKKKEKQLEFIKAFSEETIAMLPGGFYLSDRFSDLTNIAISGKMVALANMLEHFYNTNCKTLIFSGNLRVLDCIAAYIRSKGRKFARIDGQVSVDQRQAIVNQFQTKSQTLLPFMLMSTEVGGLGFNLTAASKVIIFDVNWNPTKDQQSQDRAYRIGQTEKVSVYRLVAKGTIEEIQYMRQLYKQELAINIVKGEDGGRIFDGFDSLTGIKNLFRFQEGSFFHDIKVKFGLDNNRASASASSSNTAAEHAEGGDERERKRQRQAATDEWLRNNSINQETVEKAIAAGNATDTFDFLKSIGIDPKNVHQNEEMLKARYGDEATYFDMKIPVATTSNSTQIPVATASNNMEIPVKSPRINSPVVVNDPVPATKSSTPNASIGITSRRNGIPGLNVRGFTQETPAIPPPAIKLHRPSYMDQDKEN